MSAFISGGVATFEQGRKLAEFENRKASISFSVTAEHQSDEAGAAVERAMDLAKAIVFDALGLAQPAAPAAEPAKKGPGRPRKAATDTPPSGGQNTSAAAPSTVPPSTPAATALTVDPADIAPPARQISNGSEDRKDPADIDEFDDKAAVVPVTDAQLKEACGAKAQAFVTAGNANGSQIIKDLISKKTGGPARYSEIPQAQRQAFLAELKAL